MTDSMPTRREIRDSIMEKLAGLPTGADHNGVTDHEREARTVATAHVLESSPYAFLEQPEPPQVGMKPNPAQGHGGAPASPTGSGGSLLDRLRANAQAALDGPGAA